MRKRTKNFIIPIVILIICIGMIFSFGAVFMNFFAASVSSGGVSVRADISSPTREVQTTQNLTISAITFRDDNDNTMSYTAAAGVVANYNTALSRQYLNLRINTNSPATAVEDKGGGRYVIDSTKGDGVSRGGAVVIEANYNYDTQSNIGGTHWDLSFDGAKNVLGFANLGEVGTGAFIVETSFDGSNYNQVNSALKTVNLTQVMAPENYNTQNGRYKVAYQPTGTDINKGLYIRVRFAYEVRKTQYDYYDETLRSWQNGKFEHPDTTGHTYKKLSTITTYYNILEECKFYIANNSGVVGFHNLTNNIESIKDDLLAKMVGQTYSVHSDKDDDLGIEFEAKYQAYIRGEEVAITNSEMIEYYNLFQPADKKLTNQSLLLLAEQYAQSETLEDGDMTLTGFSLDNLGNSNYIVSYNFNNEPKGVMKNGQVFTAAGKYDMFVTTPWQANKAHYTIFVNPRASEATLHDYFDTHFITSNSKRIYDMEAKVPVFVRGAINYQIKNSPENVPLSGKIVRYNDDETVSDVYTFLYRDARASEDAARVIKLNSDADNTGELDLEPGYYAAIFYTTTDFTGEITGDYYTYSYMFAVVDAEYATGPIVNQAILNSFANISRFDSRYFGVGLENVNGNMVTFAFNRYEAAYNFAYDIESVKVTYSGGKYLYNGCEYNAKTVGEAVNARVIELIKVKYFDASDASTFLTISDQLMSDFVGENGAVTVGEDILNLDFIDRDIVVLSVAEDIENYKTPIPFLNDGKIAELRKNGEATTVVEGKSNLQFISVAPYESATIKVVNIETGEEYPLAYNQNIENQLIAQDAPSGKYKVIEENLYGDGTSARSEYYAFYIAQENTSTTQITYLSNGEITTCTLDKTDADTIINANSLVIECIENNLDPFSIVKITHNSTTEIMSIYELFNYKIDELGNYQIKIVDRLGNEFGFVVNITDAVDAVILNYEDGSTQPAFVGVETNLKTGLTKSNFDFMGWYFEGSESEYISTFTPTNNTDVSLTEVWHHSIVNITWCDGDFTETTQCKPEQTIDFDTVKFSRDGYELVGFMWSRGSEKTLFTHRISSVPNVENMSITAVYQKSQPAVTASGITLVNGAEITYNVISGEAFPPIAEVEGMTFVGWMHLGVLDGVIYNDVVPALPGDVILSAIFVATPTEPDAIINNDFWAAIVGSLTDIGTGLISNIGIIAPSVVLVLLVAFLIKNRKKNAAKSSRIGANFSLNYGMQKGAPIGHKMSVSLQSCEIKEQTSAQTIITDSVYLARVKSHRGGSAEFWHKVRRAFRPKCLTIFICIILATLIGVQTTICNFANAKSVEVRDGILTRTAQIQQEKMLESLNKSVASLRANESKISTANLEASGERDISEITETAQIIAAQTEGAEAAQFEMSDTEAFLYSTVMIDLATLGYTVFPAFVRFDSTTVYGLCYTKGDELLAKENEENVVYLGSGFVAFLNQTPITQFAVDKGLTITPLDNEPVDDEIEIKYVLTIEETARGVMTEDGGSETEITYQHYIYNNEYVHFAMYDYALHADFTPITDWDAAESLYDTSAGSVFSYDDNFVVYDPHWSIEQKVVNDLFGSSFNNNASAAQSQLLFQSFCDIQDENFLEIESGTYVFYSTINMNEIFLQLQKEEMLGISAEQWHDVEQYFNEGVYYFLVEKQEVNEADEPLYYVVDERGEFVLNAAGSGYEKTTIPNDYPCVYTDVEYSTIPQPQPEPNWWLIGAGVLMIIGGIVLTCVTLGAGSPAGAGMAASGAAVIGGAAAVSMSTVVISAVIAVGSMVVAGIAIDAGLQMVMSGVQGMTFEEGVANINWNRAVTSGIFNAVTMQFGRIFEGLSVGWQVAKVASLVTLEGFANYAIALAGGATQAEAWEEFGWGIALGLVFNGLELLGLIRGLKAAATTGGSTGGTGGTGGVVDDAKNVEQKLENQLTKLPDEIEKRFENARRSATRAAKNKEIKLLTLQVEFIEKCDIGTIDDDFLRHLGSGKNITYEEAKKYIRLKKFPPKMEGHHMLCVQTSKKEGLKAYNAGDMDKIDEIIQNQVKNKNNIYLCLRDEHKKWHNNDFKNETSFVKIDDEIITSIDREKMIDELKELLKGNK